MGLTLAKVDDGVRGDQRYSVYTATFDSDYASGGESLTPANVGLWKIDYVNAEITAVGGTVNVASAAYDATNQKLQLFDETPAAVTGDVSNIVVKVEAYGH